MTDDRPPPSRRNSRLLLAIAGFFFFVPPIAVGVVLYRSFDRPPELAVDLPSSPEARRAAFRARIDAAFPTGSPEAALVETLEQQGFELTVTEDDTWPRGAEAAVEKMTCTTTYLVRWRGDGGGGLAAVDADVRAPCQ